MHLPCCGGALRKIGEDVTETLDYVPGRCKVIRHVREKLSCRACDTIVAAPAPDHAIARGRAGAGLLAHIVVSKYDDHLPLYRQAEIFAREGVPLSLATSTMSGWVGAGTAAAALEAHVFAAERTGRRRHAVPDTRTADDTAGAGLRGAGTGKTRTGGDVMYSRVATSDPSPASGHRRRCSSIRRTARGSIREAT